VGIGGDQKRGMVFGSTYKKRRHTKSEKKSLTTKNIQSEGFRRGRKEMAFELIAQKDESAREDGN